MGQHKSEDRKTPEIIQLSEAYVGGVRTHLNMLLDILRESGFGVKLLFSNRKEALDISLHPQLLHNMTPEACHPLLKKLLFCYRTIRESRRWNPLAVVHAHSFYAFMVTLLLKLFGLSNPLLITLHGGALHSRGWLHRLFSLLMPFAAPHIEAFICVSEHDRALHRQMNIPDTKLKVIPNTVDIHRIDRTLAASPNPYKAGKINIVLVSTLYKVKGVIEFLEDVETGRPFDPDRYHIHLIGTGPLQPQVESLLANADYLGELISFLGFVPEPYHYIKWADIVLFPSRSETFGLVLHEAKYVGAKIVAHRQPTALAHLDERYLVDFNDIDALKSVVEQALSADDVDKEAARAMYINNYLLFAEEYQKLYADIYQNPGIEPIPHPETVLR